MGPVGALLEVDALTVDHPGARVVDGISFSLAKGRTLGIVGESGSGKSTLALSILGLKPGVKTGGRALLDGRDLLTLDAAGLRAVRGKRIGMVFQDPSTALDPAWRAGDQIAEAVRAHAGVTRAAARARAVELLAEVGMPAPEERARAYPHQLSGGMRQRVMIAIAIASEPELLIADEPTSALDVTVQAQILALLKDRAAARGMALMLITHDLGLAADACDEVLVMRGGKAVEQGAAAEVFRAPKHPYTAELLADRSAP